MGSTVSAVGVCKLCRDADAARVFRRDPDLTSVESHSIIFQRYVADTQDSFDKCCRCCDRIRATIRFNDFYSTAIKASDVRQLGPVALQSIPPSWFIIHLGKAVRWTDSQHRDAFSVDIRPSDAEDLRLPPGRFVAREIFGSTEVSGSISDSKIAPVREVGENPDYSSMKAWLRHCSQQHPSCAASQFPESKGIRVIDVSTRCLLLLPTGAEYLTLSYVWGGVEQPAVSSLGKIPDGLPLTIHHAIMVTRELGYQHLWVDAICIDQGDLDHKLSQIAIMAAIYRGASATIVALDGQTANDGLPGVEQNPGRSRQLVAHFGRHRLLSQLPGLDEQLRHSKWIQRGWTYQEGLVSRRCIVFTKHQVYFVCNKSCFSEDLDDERCQGNREDAVLFQSIDSASMLRNPIDEVDHDFLSVNPSERYKHYSNIISDYLTRQLTDQGDVLNAVTALLEHMNETLFADGFRLGLPVRGFRQSLLWESKVRYVRPEHVTKPSGSIPITTRGTQFPSWTWAGWMRTFSQTDRMFELFPEFLGRFQADIQPPLEVAFNAVTDSEPLSMGPAQESKDRGEASQFFGYDEALQISLDMLEAELREVVGAAYSNVLSRGASHQKISVPQKPTWLQIRGITLAIPCKISMHAWDGYSVEICPPEVTSPEREHLGGIAERPGEEPEDAQEVLSRRPPSVIRLLVDDDSYVLSKGASVTDLEFLLVFGRFNATSGVLVMKLILLKWVDGVAYRAGVLELHLHRRRQFESFWGYSRPVYRDFLFG